MINQHPIFGLQVVQAHQHDLRQYRENIRLARRVQGPRPLRRRVGRLFVAFGQALQGRPATAAEGSRRFAA